MMATRNESLAGHNFVVYGDSCSGVAGAAHEATFSRVNAVLRALRPAPDFIAFLGGRDQRADERHAAELRRQWQHFFEAELAQLDRGATPFYHTTGNHTVYDRASEAVFREVMAHLPRNGPADQGGLSYFVRRGDLLLVFVNTLWIGAAAAKGRWRRAGWSGCWRKRTTRATSWCLGIIRFGL